MGLDIIPKSRRVKVDWLYSYAIPPIDKDPRKLKDVRLRVIVLIGFMESGKTTLAKYLMKRFEYKLHKRFGKDLGVLNIVGKTIIDVMKYLEDHKDLLENVHYINLFVDDMLFQGLSYLPSKLRALGEKIYANIRHEFEEKLGWDHGVIMLFFAGQRWNLIPTFFRNAPIIIFKSIIAQDKYERKAVEQVLKARPYDTEWRDYYNFLLYISDRAYTNWEDEFKRFALVKHFRRGLFIFEQDGLEEPKKLIYVPLNYSGFMEEQAEDYDRMRKTYLQLMLIGSLFIYKRLQHIGINISERKIRDNLRRLGYRFNENLVSELSRFINENTTALELLDKYLELLKKYSKRSNNTRS